MADIAYANSSVTATLANLPNPMPVEMTNLPSPMQVEGPVSVTSIPAISGVVDVGNAVSLAPNQSVNVGSMPNVTINGTVPVSGSVNATVGNFPSSFSVSNFPANQAVTATISGTPTVTVGSLPNVTVNGPLATTVGNFPSSFSVSNFPATQPVSGTVDIGTMPSVGATISPFVVNTAIAALTAAGTQSASVDVSGTTAGIFQYTLSGIGALTVATFSVEFSLDGTNWFTLVLSASISITSATTGFLAWTVPVRYVRCNFLTEAVTTTFVINGRFFAVW